MSHNLSFNFSKAYMYAFNFACDTIFFAIVITQLVFVEALFSSPCLATLGVSKR